MQEFAATFRDEHGAVIAWTDGSTVCWALRRPSRFAAVDSETGDAVAIRCGDCPGCREYERRLLVGQLRETYGKTREQLWSVELETTTVRLSWLRRAINLINTRRGGGNSYLLGPSGVARIVVGVQPPSRVTLGRKTLNCCVRRITNPWRGRAWRQVTRGMKVARSEYGAQVKRFYHLGLAPRAKRSWTVETRTGLRSLCPSASEGVRALRSQIGLYPPEAWHLPKRVRVKGPEEKRWARGLTTIGELVSKAQSALAAGHERAPSVVLDSSIDFGALKHAHKDGRRVSGLHLREYRANEVSAGYRSSLPISEAEAGEWAAKMVAKLRNREDSG